MAKRKIKKLTVIKLVQRDLDHLGIYDADPGWFVKDPNNPDVQWVGDYATKVDAQEAKQGLEHFWKYEFFKLGGE